MKTIPSKFSERFRTIDKLSQRRGCRVTKSWDVVLERPVLIKSLASLDEKDEHQVERFMREAQALATLHHANVVRVYDFGYSPESARWYLVTEFVDGPTLADEIERRRTASLSERFELFKVIYKSVGSTLSYVHKRGIIHRDLKPANIILRSALTPVLVDFGISLDLRKDRLTKADHVVGTPLYLAPEQASEAGTLDQRVDVYALGLILFELLSGASPYVHADPVRLIIKQIEDPVPSLTEHGILHLREINAVLSKAMAKDRRDRFETIDNFLDALEDSMHASSPFIPDSDEEEPRPQDSAVRPNLRKELANRDYLILLDSRSALIDQSLLMFEHLVKSLSEYDDDGLDIIFSGHHIDILTRLACSKSTLEVQGHSPWGFVTLSSAMSVILDTYKNNCRAGKYGPDGKKGFTAVLVLDDHVPESEIADLCTYLSAELPGCLQPDNFFISFLAGDVPYDKVNRQLASLAQKFPTQVSFRRDEGDMVSLELFPIVETGRSTKLIPRIQ
jgi:serine/threonine-protein kinase